MRQPSDVDSRCCAELVSHYQSDNQYLHKKLIRTTDGSSHIYSHIDPDYARDPDTKGRESQHVLSLGLVFCFCVTSQIICNLQK